MKITDLIGRLAPFYQGIKVLPLQAYDGWELFVPNHDSVTVMGYEMQMQNNDDQVVEFVLGRIRRHEHA